MKFYLKLYAELLVIDIVLTVILKAAGLGLMQTLLCILGSEFIVYLAFVIIRDLRLRYLLDEKCDPLEYLYKIQKLMKKLERRPKSLAFLSINEAVAHMLLGEYEIAKGILAGIDQKYLSDRNGTLLVHTIDYILCCYELDELEEANHLYDTKLPLLSPVTKRLKKSMQILVGERYYYLGQYEESTKHLKELLDIELTTRQQLGILYLLARMELKQGQYESAAKKLKKVAKFGNRLRIAEEAKGLLGQKELEEYR